MEELHNITLELVEVPENDELQTKREDQMRLLMELID